MSSSPVQVRVDGSLSPVVTVSGELTYKSAPAFKKVLWDVLDANPREVCLDCKTVDFVDSSGIGVILGAACELEQAGGRLCLTGQSNQLDHALQTAGFLHLISWGNIAAVDVKNEDAPAPDGLWQSMTLAFPYGSGTDGSARRKIAEMARTMPFTELELNDISLGAGEALSNAFRHGIFQDESDTVCVSCHRTADGLAIEIRNPGPPFDPTLLRVPDVETLPEGGMGVFLMRATMDTVEFQFSDRTISVRMTKRLRRIEETL